MSKTMICTNCGTKSTEFELAKYGAGCCLKADYKDGEYYQREIIAWGKQLDPTATIYNLLPKLPALARLELSTKITQFINIECQIFLKKFNP